MLDLNRVIIHMFYIYIYRKKEKNATPVALLDVNSNGETLISTKPTDATKFSGTKKEKEKQ